VVTEKQVGSYAKLWIVTVPEESSWALEAVQLVEVVTLGPLLLPPLELHAAPTSVSETAATTTMNLLRTVSLRSDGVTVGAG
jgi:hypothetical protein